MALATMIAELARARKNYQDMLESLGGDAQKAIAEYLVPHIPEGCLVRWRQYTPYFNDGEACVFSAGNPEIVPIEVSEEIDGVYCDDWSLRGYGMPDREVTITRPDGTSHSYLHPGRPEKHGITRDAALQFLEAWTSLPDDMLLHAFGDHVSCSIRKDGTFTIKDYDHA